MTRNALPHPGTATYRHNHIPAWQFSVARTVTAVSPPRWCWGSRSCARETKLIVTLCFLLREATISGFCQHGKYLNTEPTLLTWGSSGRDADPHGAPAQPCCLLTLQLCSAPSSTAFPHAAPRPVLVVLLMRYFTL